MPSSNYRAGARLRVPMQLPFVSNKDRFEKGKPMKRERIISPELRRRIEERRRCNALVVARLRTEKGWTQAELAERAGVSLRWIKAMESNQLPRDYRMEHEIRVVMALGFGTYEIKDFYGLVDDMVDKNLGQRRKGKS
jgi:DNA-binding XRE family transcriptional regulator